MPWQVGIDEAGYGPNLGPLAMAVVACRVPTARADLWQGMRRAVRRHGEKDDGRLLVADSKLVYSPGKGLACLEASVLGFLCGGGALAKPRPTLGDLLGCVCPQSLPEIQSEPWYHGTTALPVAARPDCLQDGVDGWRRGTKDGGVRWGLAAAVLVAPARFNSLVAQWGSKGVVLAIGLHELVQHCLRLPGDEPVDLVIDKHGGRNQYGAVLQEAFADGMVLGREEGAERSIYEVIGLGRPIRVTFMPRADSAAFCVSLASMVCKYLREVLMGEFNQFWQTKMPGLRPTAGYHTDALRFFEAIEPALAKLGIAKELIWRTR
jgi:hypothetical protein